jgi:hypothetical protein
MIDIKTLPKEPIDALTQTLSYCIAEIPRGSASFGTLKKGNHSIATDLILASMIIKKSAARLNDPVLVDLIYQCVQLNESFSVEKTIENFETALNAVIVHQLDDHFIDQDAVALFDSAELNKSEKGEIRELMASARQSVDRSATLSEKQRKNLLYHISKIENELHKEKSSLQTFVAAAYDVSGILKRVGEDAQPIAEAIEKARTITEKRVEGRLEIGRDEEQKKLPKPSDP